MEPTDQLRLTELNPWNNPVKQILPLIPFLVENMEVQKATVTPLARQ